MDIGQFTIISLTIANLVREKTRSGEGTWLRTLIDKTSYAVRVTVENAPTDSWRHKKSGIFQLTWAAICLLGGEVQDTTKIFVFPMLQITSDLLKGSKQLKQAILLTMYKDRTIRQKREEIRDNNHRLEKELMDDHWPLDFTLLHLVKLTQRSLGKNGYFNKLAQCGECNETMIVGMICGNILDTRLVQIYKTRNCDCIFTSSETCACLASRRAGITNELMLSSPTLPDEFCNQLDYQELYCYYTCTLYTYTMVVREREEFVCKTCFEKWEMEQHGGTITEDRMCHISSLDKLLTECLFCEEPLLIEGCPEGCSPCRENCFTNKNTLRQGRRLRTWLPQRTAREREAIRRCNVQLDWLPILNYNSNLHPAHILANREH